jgi:hypothetical protein
VTSDIKTLGVSSNMSFYQTSNSVQGSMNLSLMQSTEIDVEHIGEFIVDCRKAFAVIAEKYGIKRV